MEVNNLTIYKMQQKARRGIGVRRRALFSVDGFSAAMENHPKFICCFDEGSAEGRMEEVS
jgi:hypothetical protein